MPPRPRAALLALYALLALAAAYAVTGLRFAFDFASFFPQDDPDLAFFEEFTAEFEADDAFMLVAAEAPPRADGTPGSVFDTAYLRRFHDLVLRLQDLPQVGSVAALTKLRNPVRTPFGMTSTPVLHRDSPARLARDSAVVMADERYVYNLVSPDASTLAILARTTEEMTLEASDAVMDAFRSAGAAAGFGERQLHYLGRAYFQSELIRMQKREVLVSTVVSGALVTVILFLIYRRWRGVAIAMVSIALALLLFFGLLVALGRELSAMAALYPVLMVIVGTSDLIHLMTKYVDELRAGQTRAGALRTTVREIGLATLLTSVTTAVGFATLLTSRVGPIRDFGLNAGLGVVVAFVTVLTFTLPLLTFFTQDQLMRAEGTVERWDRWLLRLEAWVRGHPRGIVWGAAAVLGLCAGGIALVDTNYRIVDNLPRDSGIKADFLFFEDKFTGFRPVEFAVFVQDGYRADDLAVLREMDRLEAAMRAEPTLRAVASQTTLVKSVRQAMAGGQPDDYRLPATEAEYARLRPLLARAPKAAAAVLVNEAGDKARITSRALDVGSDSIRRVADRLGAFAETDLDSSVIRVRETGTGLLLDKNSVYVRESLLWGLGGAVGIIAVLMALLYRNWRMLFVSIVPNVVPLLFAGALLGYLGIELEAGISIIFAVIFGIAVDDTIHFLAKYKLARGRGRTIDEAMAVTFRESGKAIILTSVILFFGFLVMLFSVHPPSVTVGLLISVTLVSAVVADLALIPVLLRWVRI